MKKLLLILPLIVLVGCSGRLAPGGAYSPITLSGTNIVAVTQPDMGFYVADAAFGLAYAACLAAGDFELNNRVALWQLDPNIKHSIDRIRPQVITVRNQYIQARKVYMSMPVPANLTVLQQILAKMQQLMVTATAVLPKGK